MSSNPSSIFFACRSLSSAIVVFVLFALGCSSKEPTKVSETGDRSPQKPQVTASESKTDSENSLAPVQADGKQAESTIRFATFNVALNRKTAGQLKAELASGNSKPAEQLAEIIQRTRPQVLLLNEFDYDAEGLGISSFQSNFLAKPQHGQDPIEYEFVYFQSVNTGVDSGLDLDSDGKKGTANDAYGYGEFPGQYGMVVLSQFPIDYDNVRTFQTFLWADLPDYLRPIDPKSDKHYYSNEVEGLFRLSSKSHWDVPIKVDDKTIQFLVSHPTPPVFDGEEDRNGLRNHDEIRFWNDYISGKSEYFYDDNGKTGGLKPGSLFVIAGDLNADPVDGDSRLGSAKQLTENPLINNSFTPQSAGGTYYAKQQAGKNESQTGNPACDTGDFNDASVGNMRVDYCLPSRELKVTGSGVFWPTPDQPGGDLVGASDHRMVWIDVVR